ncbi:tetratricopeptide repeat protein [Streptomyces fulvoviolaceus]|uniref:tetratricopeptide repeat protein n=1 Tax=Streptomyces fulvoviolaceus TaxID=285535 RepID=UPI0006940AE7|nr:tetratricopeptide repeat protein [Streptomyces fulvoviolaceus]
MVVKAVADRAIREFAGRLRVLRDSARAKNADLHRASKSLVAEKALGVRELSTTRLSALLKGELADAPDWDMVRTFVLACERHAADHAVRLEPAEADLAMWQRRLESLDEVLRLLERIGGDGQEPASTVPSASLTLPAASSVFTGRDDELRRLLDVLAPTPGISSAAAVAGMGGIGKTALALAAAHHAVEQGWFTDTYAVNLRGYDPAHVTAHQALESLLRAMGAAPEDIPTVQPEREGLYRSTLAALAAADRRVLILADNAYDSDQILPLLPGPGPHRLLATSRHTQPQLASHGAWLIDLGTLTPQTALGLLRDVLRRAGRSVDDQESAERLVELSDRIPLALHIAAGLLVVERGRTIAGLTAELAGARSRLDHLDDGERALRATFDLSYDRLPLELARLFRLLALNPGPDIGLPAAVALADREEREVRAGLRELVRGHVVDSAGERWGMHDLVRDFAVHHAPKGAAEEGRRALLRLLGYYTQGVEEATVWLREPRVPAAPNRFVDGRRASAWLRTEHTNLLAVPAVALAAGDLRTAVLVPNRLDQYLTRGRYFDDAIALHTMGLVAARLAEHPRAVASALGQLGLVMRHLRRFDASIQLLTESVVALRNLGDDVATATVLNNLGNAQSDQRRFEAAIETLTEAGEVFERVGDLRGYADTLHNRGNILQGVARHPEAVALHAKAADIYERLGEVRSRAAAALGLSSALRSEGRYDEAEAAISVAAEIFEELDDEHDRAAALANRSGLLRDLGRTAEAAELAAVAAGLFASAGDEYNEAKVQTGQAMALEKENRLREAAEKWRTAAVAFERLGDRYEEGVARLRLGRVFILLADVPQAFQYLAKAVGAYAAAGAPNEMGEALSVIAQLQEICQTPQLARVTWLTAAKVYEAAGEEQRAARARQSAEAVKEDPQPT